MRCPNCGAKLEFILGEWICSECEYHTKELSKRVRGSFR